MATTERFNLGDIIEELGMRSRGSSGRDVPSTRESVEVVESGSGDNSLPDGFRGIGRQERTESYETPSNNGYSGMSGYQESHQQDESGGGWQMPAELLQSSGLTGQGQQSQQSPGQPPQQPRQAQQPQQAQPVSRREGMLPPMTSNLGIMDTGNGYLETVAQQQQAQHDARNPTGWTDIDLSELPSSSIFSPVIEETEMDERRANDDIDIHELGLKKEAAEWKKMISEAGRKAGHGADSYTLDINGAKMGRRRREQRYLDPWNSKPPVPYSEMPSGKMLFKQTADSNADRILDDIANKDVGARVWAKIHGDDRLGINEVSIGYREFIAAITQNPAYIDDLLLPLFPDGASNHDVVNEVIPAINKVSREPGKHIYVGVAKPPDVDLPDAQSMILRISTDTPRGIFINPYTASLFNADLDGDDANVSFDKKFSNNLLRTTMDVLINHDGTTKLDDGWFTTIPIVDNKINGMSRREVVTDVIFKGIRVNDEIIDCILAIGDWKSNKTKSKNQLLVDLLSAIKRFTAYAGSGSMSDIMFASIAADEEEKILHAAIDGFKKLNRYVIANSSLAEEVDKPVKPKTDNDRMLLDFIDDVVVGKIPNNWLDHKRAINAFIGEAKKSNSDFRISGSVGKKFKLDNSLLVGGEYHIDLNDGRQVETFIEATMDYAQARRMSNEYKKEGRTYSIMKEFRHSVAEEVGFPSDYSDMASFLYAFTEVYSRESAFLNEANMMVKTNGQISQSNNRITVSPLRFSETRTMADGSKRQFLSFGDLADPIISIYGDVMMDRFFSKIKWNDHEQGLKEGQAEYELWRWAKAWWLRKRFQKFSIRQFSNNNHVITNQLQQSRMNECVVPIYSPETGWYVETVNKNDKGEYVISSQFIPNISDNIVEMYLIKAIADQKTSSESAYASRVYGYVNTRNNKINTTFRHNRSKQTAQQRKNDDTNKYHDKDSRDTLMSMRYKLLKDILDVRKRGRSDKFIEMGNIVRLMNVSGPEMFDYFGLNSMVGWEASPYAKAMEKAATLGEQPGIDLLGGINMAMHYTMKTDRITKLVASLDEAKDAPGNSEYYAQIMNEIAFIEQEISSSSQTWEAIMREGKTGTAWSGLQEKAKEQQRNPDVRGKLTALDYWLNGPRHENIHEMMMDLSMGFVEKRNVLCDVVRYQTDDMYFRSYEVSKQLEVDAGGEWSLTSDGKQQLFAIYNDFERMYNQYGDTSYANMVKNVEEAYSEYGKSAGALTGTIHTLVTHPGMLCKVSFETMSFAVCSVMDRMYDQTEKSKTHPWSNNGYQATTLQGPGGYYNELFRTDDLVVGMQSIRGISIVDLLNVLDDPNYVAYGYNDIGEIIQTNRAELLGLREDESYDIEKEIWKFLRDNPRIAGCLRMQEIAVTSSSDAKAYIVAACDTSETIRRCRNKDGSSRTNVMDDIAFKMFNHTNFHGIVSLVTPAVGRKSVFRAPYIAQTEKYLCWLLYKYATNNPRQLVKNADEVLEAIGVTHKALDLNLMSDYNRQLIEAGGAELESDTLERQKKIEDIYSICHQSVERYLREIASDPNIDHKAKLPSVGTPPLRIDQASVHSFYDVIQELSGAKTEVSTGIEGSETKQFGVWSQLIATRDHFVALNDATVEDIESDPAQAQRFDGAMTNAMVKDEETGEMTMLRVSVVDGKIANMDELLQAVGVDELVVSCPITYKVKDAMLDSQGRTISSHKSYMMSKRSKGAEEHNLKVMKFGIDGLDSISKITSKYFVDEDGNTITYGKRLQMIREAARAGANADEQLFLARLSLSKELLKSNLNLGYDYQTLSNYMCMAELMVIMGDDGEIYLRSLAQLYTALKYRLGPYGKTMSNEQRKRAAKAIVFDVSENAIGRRHGNPREMFSYMKPVRVSPSSHSLYHRLSDPDANMRLLRSISETLGRSPWSATDREQMERYIRDNHGWLDKMLKKAFIIRQYHVSGCVDANRFDNYHDIGMSSMFVIGEDAMQDMGGPLSMQDLDNICFDCKDHGETIIVPASLLENDVIAIDFAADAMPCATDKRGNVTWYMINTFNMRLNGSEADPIQSTFAGAQFPYEKNWISVEDSFGEFDYGDSGSKNTRYGNSQISMSRAPQSVSFTPQELFAQQYAMLGEHDWMDISFVDKNTLNGVLNHTIDIEIDPGVVNDYSDLRDGGDNGFARRKRDIDNAIKRYMEKTDDGDGKILDQDCEAGDIVAWALAKVHIEGKPMKYVIAPIIPFPLHGVKRGMERFQCREIQYKKNGFEVTMVNTSELEGLVKMFAPSGATDKMTTDLSRPIDDGGGIDRTLKNGMRIHSYHDARTTEGRRVGEQKRLVDMATMMSIARQSGYNFAFSDGAFPDAGTERDAYGYAARLSEALKYYPPPSLAEWNNAIRYVRFHMDTRMDNFIRFNCQKFLRNGINPSHFLASEFLDPRVESIGLDPNVPINSMYQWEYIPSFENGQTYEDMLLKYLRLMDPHGDFDGHFCPNGIDDNDSSCLFRLKQDEDGILADGYDRGTLQMQVPHHYVDIDGVGKWVYVWETVVVGHAFFGEESSFNCRPNVDGASRMSDVMTMIGNTDIDLEESDSRLLYAWGISDLADMPMLGNSVTLWR